MVIWQKLLALKMFIPFQVGIPTPRMLSFKKDVIYENVFVVFLIARKLLLCKDILIRRLLHGRGP